MSSMKSFDKNKLFRVLIWESRVVSSGFNWISVQNFGRRSRRHETYILFNWDVTLDRCVRLSIFTIPSHAEQDPENLLVFKSSTLPKGYWTYQQGNIGALNRYYFLVYTLISIGKWSHKNIARQLLLHVMHFYHFSSDCGREGTISANPCQARCIDKYIRSVTYCFSVNCDLWFVARHFLSLSFKVYQMFHHRVGTMKQSIYGVVI